MTQREKQLLQKLWEDETDPEWREALTDEESEYLKELDEQFFAAVQNLSKRILELERKRTEKGN